MNSFGISILSAEQLARNLQEHEVVIPEIISGTALIQISELKDVIGSERLQVKIRAFGEEFLLDLKKNYRLVASKFSSEILNSLHSSAKRNISRNCYYIGRLRFRSQSSVALSGCHGLVSDDNVPLFISHVAFVYKLFHVVAYPGELIFDLHG